MDDLREDVRMQKCAIRKLVNSRMKWAGHAERRDEDRPPMMTQVHQEKGRRRRGRPRFRRFNYTKRDTKKAALEDEYWRTVAHCRIS